jgi:hypothetical protein
MIRRFLFGCLASFTLGVGFASAQLDKPLPEALVGESNNAYDSYLTPSQTPAFRMPSRVENPIWVRAEGLLSWSNAASLPPLLTTSPPGTARGTAGVFGSPGAETLIGGTANNGYRNGVAFGFGVQPFKDYSAGLELGFSVLNNSTSQFTDASDSSRILGRPFTIAGTNQGQAVLVAFPGLSSGSFDVRASSGNLYVSNITATDRIIDTGRFHLTGLVGYRRYDMNEEINMLSQLVSTDPATVPGTTIRTFDRFRSLGTFHGADLGFRAEVVEGPFAVEILTRMAVGQLSRSIDIQGNQLINVPGAAPVVNQGGMLALASNIGHFTSQNAQIMPEFGTTGKWQITPHIELRLGYSIFLLQGVARAADQIDTTISTNNFPPVIAPQGSSPAPILRTSNIWVQNLSLGLNFGF